MPERRVIVDTGPLVAFLVEEDHYHGWAITQFRRLEAPFITCEPVLTETCHLVSKLRGGRRRFLQVLDSGLLVADFNLLSERRPVARLMEKYADQPMSLADACVVRLSEVHDKLVVFTSDSHFSIYRRHARQPIPLISP